MKNKNKNILLGFVIGVLAVGAIAAVGSALNEQNGWFDNLTSDIEEKLSHSDNSNYVLDANNLEVGTLTEDFESGIFTINATIEKSVVVEAQEKSYGDLTFNNRIKCGGAGSDTYRSIEFTIDEEMILEVYWRSPSAEARDLTIYDEDVAEITSFSSLTDQNIVYSYTDLDAGTYYLYGSAALDFYKISLLDIDTFESNEIVNSSVETISK